MIILHIETSGLNCSVALSKNNHILAEKSENAGKFTHSENLHLFIEDIMQQASLPLSAVDAIAVSAGAGSYTGLRIGIATAKGLCFALEKPLIAIPTLQILAHQAQGNCIIPMLDARRMEVYTAQFTAQGQRLSEDAPLILDEHTCPLQQGKYILVGNGASKARGLWPEMDYEVWDEGFAPEATVMIPLATAHYEAKDFVDTAYWTPNYLKEYVAVIAKNKVLGR